MPLPGIIKTLKVSAERIYKEKGSEFIAKAFQVESETDVQNYLDETKKKYYAASHHCYAYRLKDESFRYSDAGEPNGTAGIRILNAIDHFGIKNILIVVTRYFGGIKLGIGPLGKAYYTSSELLLQKCSFTEEMPFNKVIIVCDFDYISLIHRELSNYSGILENIEYGESVRFIALLHPDSTETFKKVVMDASNGNVKITAEKGIIFHKI